MLELLNKSDLILDTCSIINLINSHQLVTILDLTQYQYYVGVAVYYEISKVKKQKDLLDELIKTDKIKIWKGDISVDKILELQGKYQLGDGETEAICICAENQGCILCCDDRKARKKAEFEFESSRIFGSLRLLKHAVESDLIKCTDAEISFLEMKLKGGFLPKQLPEDYFCKNP